MNEIERLRRDIDDAREMRAEQDVKRFILAGVAGIALLVGVTIGYNVYYAEEHARHARYEKTCQRMLHSIFKEDNALYTRQCAESAIGWEKIFKSLR